MATTQRATPRKTLTLQRGRKSVPVVEAVKHEPRPITESMWVGALADAGGFHRDALNIELAVGLSLFATKADPSKVGLDTKKILKDVYAKAGYACATPQGEDYKTVNRRINVTADLYQHLGGRETIVDWIGDATPKQQVAMIAEHIKGYGFSGISAVMAHMGKAAAVKRPRNAPVPQQEGPQQQTPEQRMVEKLTQAREGQRTRAEDQLPPGRMFSHGPVNIAVPLSATYEDVMAIVADLTLFAASQLRVGLVQPHPPVLESQAPKAELVAA